MSEILTFLQTIWQTGEVREIRAFDDRGQVWYGYFDTPEKAAQAAEKINATHTIYVTLNPCKPALLARCANKIKRAGKKDPTTSDKDIAELRLLLIDLDPDRPAGISASEEEKKAAVETAKAITYELGNPLLVGDSGNGTHLVYQHNAKHPTALKAFLSDVAELYNTTIKIDTAVFNPARITKILGTWARKGDNTPDRPHRQSKILKIYDNPIVLDIPAVAQEREALQQYHDGKFDYRKFLADHNLPIGKEKPGPGGTTLLLFQNGCPFDSSHVEGESAVVLHPSGMASFQCFHSSCKGRTWADLRARIGAPKKTATPTCKHCGKEIVWATVEGHWRPENADGGVHQCHTKTKEEIKSLAKPKIIPKVKTLLEISKTEYPPTCWAIEGVIPAGVSLIAGPPKIGKSLLALQIVLQVACIRFDKELVSTPPGSGLNDSLYLALEDCESRIKQRVEDLFGGKELPKEIERVHIATTWGKGEEAIAQVKEHLDIYAYTKLIVVDTLGRVRGKEDTRKRLYDLDTESIAGWQKIALERNISIVIIHHTRKGEAEDPFDKVSGSTGLTGVCDALLVISRQRNQGSAKLSMTGRDLEEQELALEFKYPAWKLLGDARNVSQNLATKRIQEALQALGGRGTPKEIYHKLLAIGHDIREHSVQVACLRASERNEIAFLGMGIYSLITIV